MSIKDTNNTHIKGFINYIIIYYNTEWHCIILLLFKFVLKYLAMTTLSSVSKVNDIKIINYKVVFERIKCAYTRIYLESDSST